MADPLPLSLDDFFDGDLVDEVDVAALLGTDRDRADPEGDQTTIWTFTDPPYGRDLKVLLGKPYSQDAIRADIEGTLEQVGLKGTVTVDGQTGEVFVLRSLLVLTGQMLTPEE